MDLRLEGFQDLAGLSQADPRVGSSPAAGGRWD